MENTDLEWIGVSGEDGSEDRFGLDFSEQQRSLERASKWEAQPEFIGIPDLDWNAIPRALAADRKTLKISPEDREHLLALIQEFRARD